MRDAIVPQFGEIAHGVNYIDRPGSYALIVRDGALLIVETASGRFLPGGGLGAAEAPEDALRRELLEETGLVPERFSVLGTARQLVTESSTGTGYNKIETFYLVSVIAEHATPTESDHNVRWLPLAEARDILREEAQRWAVGLVGGM